jgi:hypothetical protein
LRKNKRPPCLGCWKIESIGSSDRNGDIEEGKIEVMGGLIGTRYAGVYYCAVPWNVIP